MIERIEVRVSIQANNGDLPRSRIFTITKFNTTIKSRKTSFLHYRSEKFPLFM